MKGGGHSETKKSRRKEVSAYYLPLAQNKALSAVSVAMQLSIFGSLKDRGWKGKRTEGGKRRRRQHSILCSETTLISIARAGIHLCQSPGLDWRTE